MNIQYFTLSGIACKAVTSINLNDQDSFSGESVSISAENNTKKGVLHGDNNVLRANVVSPPLEQHLVCSFCCCLQVGLFC